MTPDSNHEDTEHEEQQGYRKVDRRHSRQAADTEDDAEEPAEPEPEQPAEQEPEIEQEQQVAEPAAAEPEQDVAEPSPEPSIEGEPQPEMMDWTEVGVYGVLRFATGLLMQLAWIALGVQAPPDGGETQEDLPQAKAAIDALPDLIEHLEPDLSDEEKRDLESSLANLRINYVQRSK